MRELVDHNREKNYSNNNDHADNRRSSSNNKIMDEEDKICRICHGGEDEGKLISPCKCKGSIRFVHLTCLEHWRTVSKNSKSYFQCDQCHYKYNFSRTQLGRLLSSPIAVHLLTVLVFLALIIACGYLWKVLEVLFVDAERRHWTSFFSMDLYHMATGAALVGFLGFFQLFLVARVGVLFPGGVGGAGGRNIVEVTILVIVICIGLAKAFSSLYKLIKLQTEKLLYKAENMVLDVQ